MMQFVVGGANLIVLFLIAWIIWRRQQALRSLYWPALMLKLIAGIALGLFYTYYFPISDSLAYHEDGAKLSQLARTDFAGYLAFFTNPGEDFSFWERLNFREPRALFLSQLTSIFCLITYDNYWIISIYYSMICFFATWYLLKILVRLDEKLKIAGIIALLLFPSIVFWTSGIMKETLAMSALYFIVFVFLKIWLKERVVILQWILLLIAGWILWNLKYYYMAIFLPVIATALMFRLFVFPNFTFRSVWFPIGLWLIIFLIPLYVATLVHPNFYPERFLTVIVDNYNAFIDQSSPDDVAHFSDLNPSVWAIIANAPNALFTALYRPMPWEANDVFKIFATVENVLLMFLTVTALFRWKDAFQSPHRFLIFSSLVYVVLLAIFLALSAPNFGTLTRYRVGFLPFFILIITVNNPFILRMLAFIETRFPFLGRLTS